MFTSILLPLDGSMLAEGVLPHAVAIGKAFDSRITVLQMLETQARSNVLAPLFDTLNWQINKAQAQLYLENIRQRLKREGLRVEARVEEGRVAEGIVVFAETQDVKLIILNSHGRSGISYWGLSSIAQKVILSAPSSVLLVRANEASAGSTKPQVYQRIVAPLDGSQRAESVLPIIQRLARAQNCELYLAHVVRAPEMPRHLPPMPEDVNLSTNLTARNRQEAERYLEQLTRGSTFEGVKVETRLIDSENTAAALHQVVGEQQADLVVMSAHGYSGHQDWPYGSLVNNFISYGKTSLLIVQDLPSKHEISAAAMAARERAER